MEGLKVIKIGGNVVDNEEVLASFLTDLSCLEGKFILVHGGGKIATKISKALGVTTEMIEGRRVTDSETLKVVTMVYAGLVNKSIVSKLQSKNVNAVGLSGADGNIIKSHKRISKGIDYGFVGDVDEVNSAFLHSFILQKCTPVVAPITHDGKGLLLNTNADTVAQEIAVSMSSLFEVELVYCFELPGVMRDVNNVDSVIPKITQGGYTSLKDEGVIIDGMIPKIDNCFRAISRGVHQVRICHAEELKNVKAQSSKVGTLLIS